MPKKMIVLFVIILFCFTGCISQYNYSLGKDCTHAFGDGEYQTLKNSRGFESLSNQKFHIMAIPAIDKMEITDEKIYFIGTDGFLPTEGTKLYAILLVKQNLLQIFWEENIKGYYAEEITTLCSGGAAVKLTSIEDFLCEDLQILEKLDAV